jgi:excisionase family DNA binding protein
MAHSIPDPLVFSIAEFCRSIGISRRSLYGLLDRGEGPPTIRIGRRRVIRREAADAWLRSREA